MRLAFRTVVAFARICQDSQGRTFLGSGHGVPFTTAEQLKLSLTEVSSGFVQHQVPDATPNNVLLASLVQQLQPHRVFSGEEAPFKLQLTQLSDGCALGVSVSHLLADAESLGQMLADLSSLYKGQGLPQRQETRLGMQQIISKAAGLLSSEAQPSDAEIVPTLPSLKNPPATFQDCVEFGPYIFRGLTPEERKDGTFHSAQVLHIPGRCLEKLRHEILQSSVAKQAGVDYISHTDVACALLWLIKEASSGNHLKNGLHQAISDIMGLRSNGFKDLQPNPYFGNAASIALIQPLPLTTTQSTDGSGLSDTVAAAACAVRLATRAFRSDVASSMKQMFAALPALVQAEVLRNPDMNPLKGCCLDKAEMVCFARSGFLKLILKGCKQVSFCTRLPQKLPLCKGTKASTGRAILATLASEFTSRNTTISLLVLIVHFATALTSMQMPLWILVSIGGLCNVAKDCKGLLYVKKVQL